MIDVHKQTELLNKVYQSLDPRLFTEQRTLLTQVIAELNSQQREYDKSQEAPVWLITIWEIIQWLSSVLLVCAYIYRSARTGVHAHQGAVDDSFRIQQRIREHFDKDKKLVIFPGSKHYNANAMHSNDHKDKKKMKEIDAP